MRLIITTQHRENYGSASDPYWKNKGGDRYVVDNITKEQQKCIEENGIPTLTKMLESANEMATCHIIDWYVGDLQDNEIWEPWQTKQTLHYCHKRKSWYEFDVQIRSEFDCWAHGITEIHREWKLDSDGNRSEFHEVFKIGEGDDDDCWVTAEDLKAMQQEQMA